jgi:hypothetical protein
MGESRCVCRVLEGKAEGKRPLGRPRRRWEDNVRMDLQEVGCGCGDWIGLAQDRDTWRALVSAVRNLRVSYNAGNFLTSCKQVSFSRGTPIHGVSKYYLYLKIEGGLLFASRIRMELFHSDPPRKLSAKLNDIYHCCLYIEKLLMMDRGIVRNV